MIPYHRSTKSMPPQTEPFESPHLHIQWAKDSFTNLKREMSLFDESDPYAFVIEPDTDPAYDIVKFQLVKPFPTVFNKLVVDMAGYLRHSLDQAMFAIIGKDTYFPIANSAADMDRKGRDGWKKSPPEIVAFIRALKPYKGGNNLLWALNKLANTQKHAIVCPFATIGRGFRVTEGGFSFSGGGAVLVPTWDRSKNEMKLFQIARGSEVTGESNLHMIRDITLAGIEFVDGQPVVAVFDELIRQVERIIFTLRFEAARLQIF